MLTDQAVKRSFTRVSNPLKSPTPTTISSPSVRDWKKYAASFTTTTAVHVASNNKKIYLHVGPSGDSWIGDAIFAAKHNQPGYVKSIDLFNYDNFVCEDTITGINDDNGGVLIEVLEENPEWAQEIYDTECFPETLQQHLKSLYEEDNKL